MWVLSWLANWLAFFHAHKPWFEWFSNLIIQMPMLF